MYVLRIQRRTAGVRGLVTTPKTRSRFFGMVAGTWESAHIEEPDDYPLGPRDEEEEEEEEEEGA